MDVRTQGLNILLKKFDLRFNSDGSPRYSNQSIYECIHDWVSQGNMTTNGIVAYYKPIMTRLKDQIRLAKKALKEDKKNPQLYTEEELAYMTIQLGRASSTERKTITTQAGERI